MTPEHRTLLDVADIIAIRIECTTCGAVVALKPANWTNKTPTACPACEARWEIRIIEVLNSLQHLGTGLHMLYQQSKDKDAKPPYRVRLEIRPQER